MFILTLIYFIISDLDIFSVLFSISLGIQLFSLFMDLVFKDKNSTYVAYSMSPKWLYDHSKMNKMSCKVISILLYVILDGYFIVMYLGKFIYFITHVGREE